MSATANVLEAMTAGIMAAKQGKATQLTPVGLERTSALPASVAAPFPNDHPIEAVESAVKSIRREVQYILQALDAIDATNGTPEIVLSAADVAKVAHRVQTDKEMAADARQREFEAGLKAKTEAAQAQAFARDDGPPAPTTGWQCRTHGRKSMSVMTSRKGRNYGVCHLCKEFEK
jgi:hypothetical protein